MNDISRFFPRNPTVGTFTRSNVSTERDDSESLFSHFLLLLEYFSRRAHSPCLYSRLFENTGCLVPTICGPSLVLRCRSTPSRQHQPPRTRSIPGSTALLLLPSLSFQKQRVWSGFPAVHLIQGITLDLLCVRHKPYALLAKTHRLLDSFCFQPDGRRQESGRNGKRGLEIISISNP